MKELFIPCNICKQYQPYYLFKERHQECIVCKPLPVSRKSFHLKQPFLQACNPILYQNFINEAENKFKNKRREYAKRPAVRIADNIRRRIRYLIADNKTRKTTKTIFLVGCSWEQLKQHIQSQFLPGMNWANYGNKLDQWSIDHIIPISRFNLFDNEQLHKASHYTNLRPLWHIDNMKKGSKLLCN